MALRNNYEDKREKLINNEVLSEDEDTFKVFDYLEKQKSSLDESAIKYEEDSKKQNKEELQRVINELEIKKLLSQNKEAIKRELSRLRQIEFLEKCKRSTNTKELTLKKVNCLKN